MYTIREFTVSDRESILDAIIELQDYERTLENDRLPGATIAEKHMEYMLRQCADKNGKIFVAAISDLVAGFVCVWADEDFGEHYAEPSKAGFVSDIVVRRTYRRSGIGRALLEAAEDFLCSQGLEMVHLGVLVRNESARRFYQEAGYREYEVVVVKHLTQDK